jgi:hypothetical protein
MLYGISGRLAQSLLAEDYRVRIAVPYGTYWFPCLGVGAHSSKALHPTLLMPGRSSPRGFPVRAEDVAPLSPLVHDHIDLLGRLLANAEVQRCQRRCQCLRATYADLFAK